MVLVTVRGLNGDVLLGPVEVDGAAARPNTKHLGSGRVPGVPGLFNVSVLDSRDPDRPTF